MQYNAFQSLQALEAGQGQRKAREQETAMKGIGNAFATGDYTGAANQAFGMGDLSTGMDISKYGKGLEADTAKKNAGNVLRLFSNMEFGQINEYAMQDPVGFERETGIASDEYLAQANQLQSYGLTPEKYREMVIQKAQAELGGTEGGYTLGPGQVRYGPNGEVIAEGPDKDPSLPSGMYLNPETGQPEYIPAYLEGQRKIAEARGGNQNNVQSVFTGEDGMQYIVRRDGTLEPLNVKARNPYQITDVGGVPTAIDRQTGTGVPVTTPEVVGSNKATIETITEQEKFRREQQQSLPKEMATINRGVATLKALKDSPGFDTRYGWASIIPVIPGTDMADTQALIDQIGGQAFLTAFESLKGGGQITEIEGTKATQAITILTTQGIRPETASRAIDDLISVQEAAATRMQAQAGASYGPQGADAPPLIYDPETGDFK